MRYRQVRIHHQIFTIMFLTGAITKIKCIDGLPPDVRFLYAIPDVAGINLVFESKSFDLLNDGDIIPTHNPLIFEHME